MTTQLDLAKLPRLEDMSINAVAMIVVSRVESSNARHSLTRCQIDSPGDRYQSQWTNIRKDDKPEVPSGQDSIGLVIGDGDGATAILFR